MTVRYTGKSTSNDISCVYSGKFKLNKCRNSLCVCVCVCIYILVCVYRFFSISFTKPGNEKHIEYIHPSRKKLAQSLNCYKRGGYFKSLITLCLMA